MPERKNTEKKDLGEWGESYVANYLKENGYEILSRNVRTPYGEIDLVARINDRLIFIEVKTRTSKKFGYPEDAITEEKITHMVESAESYLQDHPDMLFDWQIDVISVQVDRKKESPHLTHFENAIT
jgi:putative endonuclease